jgi:hypothetical protein
MKTGLFYTIHHQIRSYCGLPNNQKNIWRHISTRLLKPRGQQWSSTTFPSATQLIKLCVYILFHQLWREMFQLIGMKGIPGEDALEEFMADWTKHIWTHPAAVCRLANKWFDEIPLSQHPEPKKDIVGLLNWPIRKQDITNKTVITLYWCVLRDQTTIPVLSNRYVRKI